MLMQIVREVISHVRVIIHQPTIAGLPAIVQSTTTANQEVTIRVIQEASHLTIIKVAIEVILRPDIITEIMLPVLPVILMEGLKEVRKPDTIL